MRRLFLALAVVFLSALMSGAAFVADVQPARAGTTDDEFAFFDLINQSRRASGLPALAMSSTLVSAARSHSATMASADTIFHTTNLGAVAGNAASNWQAAGENVGMGPSVS